MSTDVRKIDRFVELAGMGLSLNEAARAVGISEGTGDRLMRKPDVRRRVEEARARGSRSLAQDVREVLEELLGAEDGHGNPVHVLRAKGAEMLLKYREQFADIGAEDAEDSLPEGVYRVYPLPEE